MNVATAHLHSHLVHKLAFKLRRRRKIHCFCLGAAKTGTTSFAAMFQEYYRAAHEPQAASLTDAVALILGQGLSPHPPAKDIYAWLKARDRDLNLEVEASHPLGYMAAWLPKAFPDARFVITLRDPANWLRSRLNFHYYKTPPEWQKYRDLIWARWHTGYHSEETVLEEHGLYSLDDYLAQYSEQYQLLFKHLPEDRRLIVRTEALDTACADIAKFLDIDPATITPQHANAFPCEESIVDLLPPDFVAQRIDKHCRWLRAYL